MPYTLPRLLRKYWCHHFHPTAKQILSIFNHESNLMARMSSELTEKKPVQDTQCATVYPMQGGAMLLSSHLPLPFSL